MDLPGSVTSSNIGPMFNAGIDNFDLSQYLIGQLMLSQDDRMASLREYFPEARDEDWKLVQASACRSSRRTPRKAAYCNSAPKW